MELENSNSGGKPSQSLFSGFNQRPSEPMNMNPSFVNPYLQQSFAFNSFAQPSENSYGFNQNPMFPSQQSIGFHSNSLFQNQQQQQNMFSVQNQGMNFSFIQAPVKPAEQQFNFFNQNNTQEVKSIFGNNQNEEDEDAEFKPNDDADSDSDEEGHEEDECEPDVGGDYTDDPTFNMEDYLRFRETC